MKTLPHVLSLVMSLCIPFIIGCGSANQPVNRQPQSMLDKMLDDCAKSYDRYGHPTPRGSLCGVRFEIVDGDRNRQKFNSNGSGRVCQNDNIFVPAGRANLQTSSRSWLIPPTTSNKRFHIPPNGAQQYAYNLGNGGCTNCLSSSEILSMNGPTNPNDLNLTMLVKDDSRAPGECIYYDIDLNARRDILYEGCAQTSNTYNTCGSIIIRLTAFARKQGNGYKTVPCGTCTNY